METNQQKKNNVRIAVVGCLHGHIKELYDDIKFQDEKEGKKTDLVLCCGDFQSIRNQNDLNYMSCPDKYKNLGQFHNYYSGKWEVPYLTIFIGGNHEASNVLEENYYGGWIMEKVFYLGKSGLINYKGISIAGLSGIFKPNDYFKGHYELDLIRCIKSVYHVREFELVKLAAIEKEIDIFMSHDWPTSVVNPKDFNRILKIKSFWAEELKGNSLGSPVSFYLMNSLRPTYWFSGHMHYYYENTISFASENFNDKEDKRNETHFIALDKPVQRRKYYSIIEYIPKNFDRINDENIYFDLDWLAITKTFNEYFPINSSNYDFSDFLKNRKEYLNILNEYNLLSFNISNKTKVNPNSFYKKLEENRKTYKNEIKWELKKEISQREYVLEILNMPDLHKTKRKYVLENINMRDFDQKIEKIASKDSKYINENDYNFIENQNFDYKNDINIIKINKNSEELDVDIDFV